MWVYVRSVMSIAFASLAEPARRLKPYPVNMPVDDQKTFYFAYGSNMSSARLERRVGRVRCVGRGWLDDYCHQFSKHGTDGTAKGNVEPARGERVWGVIYELDPDQLDVLATFETGYRPASYTVQPHDDPAAAVRAASFEALAVVRGIQPSPAYLHHYLAGLREHDIPRDYQRAILQGLDHILPS